MTKQALNKVPEIEPEEFELLFKKKMFLRSEALAEVNSLSIDQLESLLELLAEIKGAELERTL